LKKIILIVGVIFVLTLLGGWYLYSHYIKLTLNRVEQSIQQQYDSMKSVTQVPDGVLDQNCIYDLDTQTDDFLKGIPAFSNYTWNNDLKQATVILSEEETMIVERGGCNHFSYYCTLQLKTSDLTVKNQKEIFTKALWMAEKLFATEDYNFFLYALETGDYAIQKYDHQFLITFETEAYCQAELFFIVDPETHRVDIKIGYYLC